MTQNNNSNSAIVITIDTDTMFGPEPSFSTTSIGNDILDIGSRKALAKRQRGTDPLSPAPLALGMPGQFDLPNVDDVSN